MLSLDTYSTNLGLIRIFRRTGTNKASHSHPGRVRRQESRARINQEIMQCSLGAVDPAISMPYFTSVCQPGLVLFGRSECRRHFLRSFTQLERRCCFQETTLTCSTSFCHQKLLTRPIKLPNGIPRKVVDGLPSNFFVMLSLDSQCLLTIPERHSFGTPHHSNLFLVIRVYHLTGTSNLLAKL